MPAQTSLRSQLCSVSPSGSGKRGIRLDLVKVTSERSAMSRVESQPACHSSAVLMARISAGLFT